jgi:asparagine synthase (glutamine-hydrolysing)
MCGICGKLSLDQQTGIDAGLLKAMADRIRHRGPDDEGYYRSGPVGLGFRRLSIIDLKTGHQPISNEDGTVWIVFNGEIYNYRELREYLLTKGHTFTTRTDTEVIVHLYEEFGHDCVEKLRGMFGFAIWDDREKSLFLARDRVGIKPLYYWLSDKSLIFGSEIKAILADPEAKPEVALEMIDRFLTLYYMPGEKTMFRNIFKLPPGSYMVARGNTVRIQKYWDLQFAPLETGLARAEQQLLELLEECVRLHMISDVPVGFLLSGGVDSTAMLDLAVGKTEQTLSSFTIGFDSPGVPDERPYAALAARRYGTDHHEMTISSTQFADFLPTYAWHMEEPVCEPAAIAMYYVSRLAKDWVKVLISGEGGDEAFAGYPCYRNLLWLERIKKALGPLTGGVSRSMSLLYGVTNNVRLAKYAPLFQLPFESYYYSRISGPQTFFNVNKDSLYSKEFAHLIDREFSLSPVKQSLRAGKASSLVNRMLYVDTTTALPDDLLLKADKMTMANSIELRVPLLDHQLLEFAARLPEDLKVRGFTTKYVAKKLLQDRIPREIIERKKAGFPVPYETWLRTELKGWIRDVLFDRETLARGYFNRASVENLIRQDATTRRHSKDILSLVALEMWHRAFINNDGQRQVPRDPHPPLTAAPKGPSAVTAW